MYAGRAFQADLDVLHSQGRRFSGIFPGDQASVGQDSNFEAALPGMGDNIPKPLVKKGLAAGKMNRRGNGYVVTVEGKRIYVAGDTEDIPEMRALKNIDYAFVCMNLPYTMTPEQAASAVLEFKPKVVIPYHDRGSDVEKFKQLVEKDKSIEVRLLKWYE